MIRLTSRILIYLKILTKEIFDFSKRTVEFNYKIVSYIISLLSSSRIHYFRLYFLLLYQTKQYAKTKVCTKILFIQRQNSLKIDHNVNVVYIFVKNKPEKIIYDDRITYKDSDKSQLKL